MNTHIPSPTCERATQPLQIAENLCAPCILPQDSAKIDALSPPQQLQQAWNVLEGAIALQDGNVFEQSLATRDAMSEAQAHPEIAGQRALLRAFEPAFRERARGVRISAEVQAQTHEQLGELLVTAAASGEPLTYTSGQALTLYLGSHHSNDPSSMLWPASARERSSPHSTQNHTVYMLNEPTARIKGKIPFEVQLPPPKRYSCDVPTLPLRFTLDPTLKALQSGHLEAILDLCAADMKGKLSEVDGVALEFAVHCLRSGMQNRIFKWRMDELRRTALET